MTDMRAKTGRARGGTTATPRRELPLTFVVTRGDGSLDYYSQKLARHLPVARVETSGLSWRAPQPHEERAFLRVLQGLRGAVHFPNHHFGRYGHLAPVPYVITVHDLIRYLDLQGSVPLIHRATGRDRIVLRRDYDGIRKAPAIIAVSETTKRDLMRELAVPEGAITVVYQGIDHAVFRPVDRRLIDVPYVLFVGSEQPRKNLRLLFHAFARLKTERRFRELKLVKVGSAGGDEADFRRRTLRALDEFGLRAEVLLVEQVEEQDLVAFYGGAELLVLPSLYEGFGFPPLEAMACGCPVIVSSAGCLPEVAGPAAIVCDPQDAGALASAMRDVLTSDARRKALRARGLEHARRFTWERTAAETLRVYERALSEKRAGRRGSSEDDLPLRFTPRSGPLASDGV